MYAYSLPDPATYTYQLSPFGTNVASRGNIGFPLVSASIIRTPPGYAPILPTPTNLGSDTSASVLYSSAAATDLAVFATEPLLVHRSALADRGPARRPVSRQLEDGDGRHAGRAPIPSPTSRCRPSCSIRAPALVFEPDEAQTYYFSWGKAATPQGTSVVGSPNPAFRRRIGAQARQEREYRAGCKFALFGRRAGPFGRGVSRRPSRTRCRSTPPPATSCCSPARSSGCRASRVRRPASGGAPLRHRVLHLSRPGRGPSTPTAFNIGKQITFVPKNSASLWVDYNAAELVPGLSFGGGLFYQSHLFNNYARRPRNPPAHTVPVGYPLGRVVEIPETVELDAVGGLHDRQGCAPAQRPTIWRTGSTFAVLRQPRHAGGGPHLHLLGGLGAMKKAASR
ncbi:MAG: hypothetical protein WDM81_03185 [Rhizomicrobium sp.]